MNLLLHGILLQTYTSERAKRFRYYRRNFGRWEREDRRLSFPGETLRNISKAAGGGLAGGVHHRLLPLRQHRGRRRHRPRLLHRALRGHALGDRDGALPCLGGPAGDDRGHPPAERPRRLRAQTRHAPGVAQLGSESRRWGRYWSPHPPCEDALLRSLALLTGLLEVFHDGRVS